MAFSFDTLSQNIQALQTRRSSKTSSRPREDDDEINASLRNYKSKARDLEATEEGRGMELEAHLRGADQAASVPTISEADIRRRFTGLSDSAGDVFLDKAAGLRDYMGASGVTSGGLPAGVLMNAEVQRLGQLTQARGDLMAFKATQDALDRQRAFDRAQVVGDAINRPVSMLGADYANQELQTNLSKYAIDKNLEGDKAMAKAQKDASSDSMLGGLIGTGASLLTGLFA